MSYASATDEMVKELRAKIGMELKGPRPHLTEANLDGIYHWAEGIGDYNPLWLDPEYAAKTRWGGVIAPPSILYCFDRYASSYGGGMSGIHGMFAGTDWKFYKPVRAGDKITAKAVFKDLIEKTSQFSGRAWQQITECTFYNQHGEVVAVSQPWNFRTERTKAHDKGKYKRLEPKQWTPEEIAAIAKEYEKENVRGATPRYWEDVQVGEALPPVIKGPLTVTGVVVFEMGWGGLWMFSHGKAFEYFKKHPGAGIPNELGVPEPPERVHWDHEFAKSVGVPYGYDYGPERVAWMGHLMTNWIGDDGFLQHLYTQVRRFNLVGDATWCKGEVTGKEIVDGQHLVHVKVWAEDQRGEQHASGHATAVLPSRG